MDSNERSNIDRELRRYIDDELFPNDPASRGDGYNLAETIFQAVERFPEEPDQTKYMIAGVWIALGERMNPDDPNSLEEIIKKMWFLVGGSEPSLQEVLGECRTEEDRLRLSYERRWIVMDRKRYHP